MEKEISAMLALSFAHVQPETVARLKNDSICSIAVFPKWSLCTGDSYGYFICIPEEPDPDDVPKDLLDCISLATREHCSWLMLDRDGPEYEELTTYKW